MSRTAVSVNVNLKKGVKDDGTIQTTGVSIGRLSSDRYDDSKAFAIVNASKAIFDKGDLIEWL